MSASEKTFGCMGNTIKVSAGHYVDLAEPNPATIEIVSIAAALSKICRFGGHCPVFYSVAEHCVHAAFLAWQDGFVGDALIAVLLHDAAEAYIGDMVKPLKIMMPQYCQLERRIESAVEVAFGVDFTRWQAVAKKYDLAMLKAEKIAMWPDDAAEWVGFSEIDHRKVPFGFYPPHLAKEVFLDFARNLGIKGTKAT